MNDFELILGLQWDAGNAYKNKDKHGVSQVEAEEIFFNQPLLIQDYAKHSIGESRFLALGITAGGKQLSVIFTLRVQSSLIRVVSARPMSKKEKESYEKVQ